MISHDPSLGDKPVDPVASVDDPSHAVRPDHLPSAASGTYEAIPRPDHPITDDLGDGSPEPRNAVPHFGAGDCSHCGGYGTSAGSACWYCSGAGIAPGYH